MQFMNFICRTSAALLAGLLMVSAPARAQDMSTSAPHAILVDYDTRSVLFEKDADEPMSPASMVKIMTAEIVFNEIKAGRLSLDDSFLISQNAWKRGGASSGGSTMFAEVNSQVRVEDLLRGMIVQSGNDAAIALAEGIAGSEESFAAMMTARARALGLKDSVFRNAWGGYHPEQRTTARDLASLAIHMIETYPELYKMFGETEFTWNKIRQPNRNPLLGMNIGADGLKTGMINESGYGLVGSAAQNDRRVIVVVNGLKSGRERAQEARKLIVWGLRAFEAHQMFEKGERVGFVRVYGGSVRNLPVAAARDVSVLLPFGAKARLSGRIQFEGPLVPPVRQGDRVARLKLFGGDALRVEAPLIAAESVETGALHQRALDASLELVRGLFNEYVLGKTKSAGTSEGSLENEPSS